MTSAIARACESVNVSAADHPHYRTQKGEITTNVLAICSPIAKFIFVLLEWKGSTADSRVLRNAISRPHGLKVPKGIDFCDSIVWIQEQIVCQLIFCISCLGYHYLCDVGYPNVEGFLVPYRGERYHLSKWCGAGNAPTNPWKFFNMKHSSARNCTERVFGVLKGRWAILRAKSYYLVKIQYRTITACYLLHNLIMREMCQTTMPGTIDDEDSTSNELDDENIQFIETSDEWTNFKDELAMRMFDEWEQAS
ncbi:uncharacterized protein LOC120076178 [Benincasa hispida]|uniref:uncharacterized protein LOC120076178 n=1 Tax=Benincasa hispida TaxID=102211 RepID=UPI00190230D6|nr:uncharacterized protein LOC120076178 [Benincasa hispida]